MPTVWIQSGVLQEASRRFLEDTHTIGRPVKHVHVLQGEYALIDLKRERCGDICVLSEEATTCCIVILRCRLQRRLFIAHVDEVAVLAVEVFHRVLAGMSEVRSPFAKHYMKPVFPSWNCNCQTVIT